MDRSRSRSRSQCREAVKPRQKLAKQLNANEDRQSDLEDGELELNADTVQFEEEENEIQMQVRASQDFESDDDTDSEVEEEATSLSPSEGSESEDSQSEKETHRDGSSAEDYDYESQNSSVKQTNRRNKNKKRQSVEDKLDTLSQAVTSLQSMMVKKGFFDSPAKKVMHNTRKKKSANSKGGNTPKKGEKLGLDGSNSETTIYQNAVEFMEVDTEYNVEKEKEKGKFCDTDDPEITFKVRQRDSTSLEDQVNTSDELMEIDINEQFIAECAAEARNSRQKDAREPHTPKEISTGEQIIQESEAAKARMFKTPGNEQIDRFLNHRRSLVDQDVIGYPEGANHQVQHSAVVDENYMVIGAHIDKLLKQKVVANEYVDFARLIANDKITRNDNNETKMELVTRGGSTFFVPANEHANVTNFAKWEQAFRRFANIYTKAYPWKSSELIQYNHVIGTAAQNFAWENVYSYDKEFRIHISNFPHRSWAVILQEAWTICLKDQIGSIEDNHMNGNKFRGKIKEPCRRFN